MRVVGEAGDGIGGEAVIVRERPAIAIVDIGLPGRDGIALTRVVKSGVPDTRVVIVTMNEDNLYENSLRVGERLPVRLSSRKLTRGLPMILRSATGLLPKMNSHQRTIESILRGFEDRAPCGYFLLYARSFAADDHWWELKDGLAAGGRYASERDWRFEVLTEAQIRKPARLWNAHFLWDSCRRPKNAGHQEGVLEVLERLGPTTLAELLNRTRAFSKDSASGYTVATYQLLASGRIRADLDAQLNPQSRIWL